MGRHAIGAHAMSAAERQRRRRAKLATGFRDGGHVTENPVTESATGFRDGGHVTELETEIAALKAALGTGNARCATLEQDLAEARTQLRKMSHDKIAQTMEFRAELARRAAKPKTEKPPLPPDEVRDGKIKELTAKNRNLRIKLHLLTEHFDSNIANKGGMSFQTMSRIAKALHPDFRTQMTDAELDETCKLFTAWKSNKDKVHRETR